MSHSRLYNKFSINEIRKALEVYESAYNRSSSYSSSYETFPNWVYYQEEKQSRINRKIRNRCNVAELIEKLKTHQSTDKIKLIIDSAIMDKSLSGYAYEITAVNEGSASDTIILYGVSFDNVR